MNQQILEAAKTYIREVKQSPEYQEYVSRLEEIKQQEEIYTKVNEFRKKNYELQSSESSERLLELVDELERELDGLHKLPLAESFLAAELDFCRKMQEANALIAKELDFQ
jgi:cell fate (sporulation/competence/biofilm development) regulator YlbF (YheA/YmcA/DUF963 family)